MDAIPESPDTTAAGISLQQDFLVEELLAGLRSSVKYIDPKFFYDERGSQLFDQITALPEYYPTRTEIKILQKNAAAIAACIDDNPVLIEPGAGSCEKVRYLLEDLRPVIYLPQDISEDFLNQTVTELNKLYPWLNMHPLVGDFSSTISLPDNLPHGRRVVFYPGSTIGNFEPRLAVHFLRKMRDLVGDDGGVVIGVDLQKDPAVLNAAYNDTAGVTAEFNCNILRHVNQILGSDIDPKKFTHYAFYNRDKSCIEMHLISEQDQRAQCRDGTVIEFTKGEMIHTESSYKYTEAGFGELAEKAGFTLAKTWLDDDRLFSVHYLE